MSLSRILAVGALAVFMLAFAFVITPTKDTYAADPTPTSSSSSSSSNSSTTKKATCSSNTLQKNKTIDGAKKQTLYNRDGSTSVGVLSHFTQCDMEGKDLGENSLTNGINQIINVVLGVLGLIAVIVIIIGGFTYITSSGDAAKVTKAKNTILYGIIGLVIALLAFAIVNFVLKEVFNGD